MTLLKNDDTLEIIYKLFQAYSYFFHQNKTEITQTLDDSGTTVPSNKDVSTGLSGKVAKTDIVQTIDTSNSSALDKVPSCAAISAFIDNKIPSTIDDITSSFTTSEGVDTVNLTVSSKEANICLVRVTELTTSRVIVNSSVNRNKITNVQSLTVLDLNNDSLGYLVEVWKKIDDQPVLVKTFYTKQS